MNILELAKQVKRMEGLMPEPNRTLLAYRLLQMLGTEYQQTGGEQWEIWRAGGSAGFLQGCGITTGLPRVEADFDISVSDLAAFINRWSNAIAFKREQEDESHPMTADMNSIRQTMINELIAIHKQKGADDGRSTDKNEDGAVADCADSRHDEGDI